MSSILVSQAAGVLTVTLNRPEKLNAFNPEMHSLLRQAIERADDDAGIRALLLTGSGRGFCAGQDLLAEANALARALAAGPTKGYGLVKRAIYASAGNSLEAQLDLERDLQREAGFSADYREGVSAFMEKREPRYLGK